MAMAVALGLCPRRTTTQRTTRSAPGRTITAVEAPVDQHKEPRPDGLPKSIVDQGTGATPTFSYPHTAVAAWLCRSVNNPNNVNCQTNYTEQYCPNNSSSQGEIFYSQITSANSPPVYNVYAVDNCHNSEGVYPGTVLALAKNGTSPTGQTAIEQDMAGATGQAAQCFHRPH